MFILDNSGSMGQDFTPDYMSTYNVSVAGGNNPWTDSNWSPDTTEKVCKDSADDDGSVSNVITTATNPLDLCVLGDVPYMTSSMNTQYYNPDVRYLPGMNADGTSKASQTNPASVLTDGYNKQNKTQLNVSTTTINLTTAYPDRVWCTKNNPTAAELIDTAVCKKNSGYLYPDATYKYGRTSSGSGSDVFGVYGAPYYYTVVPTEHCTEANLKVCTQSDSPTGAYLFPARSRWCSDPALTTCQATKTATYKYPRYISTLPSAGSAAAGYATVGGTSKNKCFSSIKVNGIEILGANICWGNTEDDAGFAAKLKSQINTYNSNPEYTAAINGSDAKRIDITSTLAAGATANGNITYTSNGTSLTMQSGTDVAGGAPSSAGAAAYTFARTNIVPAATYPKVDARTDCSGTVGTSGCSYDEEITNFANWYTYYRTRMQSMKSAASRVFSTVDDKYRVGFITIASQSSTGNYLPIARFDNVASGSEAVNQKSTWFSTFFNISPSSSTPLRSALSTVGRIFAGLKPVGTSDPIQYSCQQNFALLTTDGYWNTDSDSDVKDLSGSAIGNLDGGTTARPMYEGTTVTNATLADVAKYYYDTDLRTPGTPDYCKGGPSVKFPLGNPDVCTDNVFTSDSDNNRKQHMTTFTLGLGVDGTVTYSYDYNSVHKLDSAPVDARLDYYNIYKGPANWPVPVSGNETTVDDLWHAGINGHGTYFSAANPTSLAAGLTAALLSMNAKQGAAAAAATSTLNPVSGNNYAYVASYTTVTWKGNLEARSINTITGEVSKTAEWSVEDVPEETCAAPGTKVLETEGDAKTWYCVTPNSVVCSGGVLVGSECKVEIAVEKKGAMNDVMYYSRKIKTANSTGTALIDFDATYAVNNPSPFSAATIGHATNGLSQWASLTPTQKDAAPGTNLLNYLRGQKDYEESSTTVANQLYRTREAMLGDALESQPAYIQIPMFSYADAGYLDYEASGTVHDGFVTKQKNRSPTVYMGTNDGMMHAFNATVEITDSALLGGNSGTERWAYVPSMVIPNMFKLADKNYATKHTNYVNGSPITSDICVSGCSDSATAEWKTILVAGLNGGGRGYYALNITDPSSPELLWEFTPTTGIGRVKDDDLGYSYGQPIITKMADGTWVVLVTSGYNNGTSSATPVTPATNPVTFVPNSPAGTGKGFLYVLNAATGEMIKKIGTGVGSPTTPSGLAKIAGWNKESASNKVSDVYGGDLLGNLWRFDINTGAVMKLAELYDGSSALQPITTTPTLGKIAGKQVVFVGTGKYLETSDLTDTQKQTLYAIKDDNATTALINPRNSLKLQTLKPNPDGTDSRVPYTNTTVNFETDRGWYVDFPDTGERVNIDAKLIMGGYLLVATIVPENTDCSPGGYGWLNVFNYATGKPAALSGLTSWKYSSTIVGINVLYVDGQPQVAVVTSTDPTPQINKNVVLPPSAPKFSGTRVMWRELIQ
jgi:type IV pilus assembly protein PilY1